MKVKVIKTFKDKHTNILHGIGQELDITAERFRELNGTSFGIFVKEIKKVKTTIK